MGLDGCMSTLSTEAVELIVSYGDEDGEGGVTFGQSVMIPSRIKFKSLSILLLLYIRCNEHTHKLWQCEHWASSDVY